MLALVLVAFTFLAGLVILARRCAASGHAPQLTLGVLPLALLFVPVQLLQDIRRLLAAFKQIARTALGGREALLAMSIEHHRAWSLASWLVVAAMLCACVAQSFDVRFGASPTRARSPGDRAGLGDWTLAVSPAMVVVVGLLAVFAQRIEARVMGFLAASFGVAPPPHVEAWVAGFGAARRLGEVIGTEAILAMLGSAMVIFSLLTFAAANTFLRRAREPRPWLPAYAWGVLAATCGLAAINALRLSAAVEWGERALSLLSGP